MERWDYEMILQYKFINHCYEFIINYNGCSWKSYCECKESDTLSLFSIWTWWIPYFSAWDDLTLLEGPSLDQIYVSDKIIPTNGGNALIASA